VKGFGHFETRQKICRKKFVESFFDFDFEEYEELYSFEAPLLELPDTDGVSSHHQGKQGQPINFQAQLQSFKPKGCPNRTPRLKNVVKNKK